MREISWRLAGAPGEASLTLRVFVFDGRLRGELWQKRPKDDYSRLVWQRHQNDGEAAPPNPFPELGSLLQELATWLDGQGWPGVRW